MSRVSLLALVGLMSGCDFALERDKKVCDSGVDNDSGSAEDSGVTGDTAQDTGTDSDTGTSGDTAQDTGEDRAYDYDLDGYSDIVDCDESNATVHPDAAEICDGLDNDCDGQIDEGLATSTFYVDNDGDGYGAGEAVELCAVPESGYSTVSGDCNDADADFHPGAEDVAGDGQDTDCDDETNPEDDSVGDTGGSDTGEATDTGSESDTGTDSGAGVDSGTDSGSDTGSEPADDADRDGYSTILDCNDADAAIKPSAIEVCDSVDNDCDGSIDEGLTFSSYYVDADLDGYGVGSVVVLCTVPTSGYASVAGDCNDADAAIKPSAIEVCDSVDNDCDGSIDEGFDTDADTFSTCEGDCNDADASINPAATETFDAVDNDCDSAVDEDWQIVVKATYGSSGYYVLNAQVFNDVDELGTVWDETATQSSGTTVQVEYTTAEYGDLSASCGIRLNVSEGNPATDWLCYASAIDPSVQIDIWFNETWYNESSLVVWDAGLGNGSCSALLLVNTDTDCQPT